MDTMSSTTDDYLLGHDDPELRRLERQAAVLDAATRQILTQAGIRPGMRVLDLGTGAGDVAMLAAELVGSSGCVVSVDLADDALERAASRVAARGLQNVTLVKDDVATCTPGVFDAVVGRLVLLYCPDPAGVLHHHAARLAPGGLVVAMEYDMAVPGATPALPLPRQVMEWIVAAFDGAGLDPSLGARLPTVFDRAGLPAPELLAVQPYFPPGEGGWYLATAMDTLMPHLEAFGIATAADVGLDTLAERLDAETHLAGAWLKTPTLVGAWARVPRR
jgi:SAM-dependent methyltransferase